MSGWAVDGTAFMKRGKVIPITGMFLALACLLVACGGHNKSSNEKLKANIGIAMSNVEGFVITQGASTASMGIAPQGSGNSKLWAMLKEGTLEPITLTEGGGSMPIPVAIFDTKTYVIFAYSGLGYGAKTCNLVPVSKADGSMYCVDAGDTFHSDDHEFGQFWGVIEADATGNVVWESHGGKIIRLDLADPNHATESVQISGEEQGCSQAVNGAGDDLVSCMGSQNGVFTRVLKVGGGFFNASQNLGGCVVAGTPANPDDFYFIDETNSGGNVNELTKLTRSPSDGSFTKTDLGQIESFGCQAGIARNSTPRTRAGTAGSSSTRSRPPPSPRS